MRFWLTEEKIMTNQNRFLKLRKTLFFAIFLFAIILSGCKKPEENVGLAVQPQGDRLGVNSVDSMKVVAFTVLEDSLRSDEFGNSLLGTLNDNVFGVTNSSVYTQIRLESSAPNFLSATGSVSETVVDSVIMYLDLDTYYGHLTSQQFSVKRVTEDFFIDSLYYTNSTLSTDAEELIDPGSELIVPDPVNVAIVNGEVLDPLLRIKLKNTLGDTLVAQSGKTSLSDNDVAGGFVEYFKGLNISTSQMGVGVDEGAILYLDLLNSNSKITMYYRHTKSGEEDTLQYDFLINSNCARFNSVQHDYTGTAVEAQLNDTTLGDQFVYVQTMAGVKTEISIPDLMVYADSGIVNKAELVFPFEYLDSDPYSPQNRIFVIGLNDDGTTFFLEDQSEGDAHYGGVVDLTNKEYRVNITKHVNNVLTGASTNTSLYLTSSSAAITANRIVVNGQQSFSRNQLKFELTYTKF